MGSGVFELGLSETSPSEMCYHTALSGNNGAMVDSKPIRERVLLQKELTSATAEYLTANQMIVYDYQLFDGVYTAETRKHTWDYIESYSDALTTAVAINSGAAFSDAYYEAVYTDA
ncbi:MAG: hypothetical protein ACK5GU_03480 [Chloroflexota bacterium]|jgi:hypothetical protein